MRLLYIITWDKKKHATYSQDDFEDAINWLFKLGYNNLKVSTFEKNE